MKKILFPHFGKFNMGLLLLLMCIGSILSLKANAQTPQQSGGVNVSGKIGDYYLTISGSIAPYASVVLISNNNILTSTTANSLGYFVLPSILVSKGFSDVCFQAVDVKRLGESYTCISLSSVDKDTTIRNIFLPPTLGLEKKQVTEGSEVIAWGYTMPNGTVTLHSSDGRIFTVKADNNGYYEFHFPVAKAGSYQLFADATFNNFKSLIPTRRVLLTVIAVVREVQQNIQKQLEQLQQFINTPWAMLLALVPLLIVILWLIHKLSPGVFIPVDQGFEKLWAFMHLPFKPRRLHHWWMKGVGY